MEPWQLLQVCPLECPPSIPGTCLLPSCSLGISTTVDPRLACASIYATQFLGMAVGWPLVQCQLVVSSLWGIFYFQELTDTRSIAIFCMSAAAVFAGVVMLGLFGL